MYVDLQYQPVANHCCELRVVGLHVDAGQCPQGFPFSLGNIFPLTLRKSVQKNQSIRLAMRDDNPVASTLATSSRCHSLLDEVTAQTGIDQTSIDLLGRRAQCFVRQAIVGCSRIELQLLENPKRQLISLRNIAVNAFPIAAW
jgi:hypothetical protein